MSMANLQRMAMQMQQSVERVKQELSTEQWKAIMDKAWAAGIPHVIFTGGEPTLRDDHPDLVAYAEELVQVTVLNTNGRSLGEIIAKANPILRGWRAYFRDSHPTGLSGPDGWLRRRLRAMLRKREKRPGYGLSEADSRRWPNRWFAAQGLFSLEHGSCAYG